MEPRKEDEKVPQPRPEDKKPKRFRLVRLEERFRFIRLEERIAPRVITQKKDCSMTWW